MRKINIKITAKEVKDMYKDYEFNTSDPLNYDDETKQILDSYNQNLTQPEKIILQLYAETQSQSKTAKILNVNRKTIAKELNRIRTKILDKCTL